MNKMLAGLVALVLMIGLTVTLTGCHAGPPCSDHGGISWNVGGVYQCADGTRE